MSHVCVRLISVVHILFILSYVILFESCMCMPYLCCVLFLYMPYLYVYALFLLCISYFELGRFQKESDLSESGWVQGFGFSSEID